MPDFNDQQEAIARQRDQCRQQDESLYSTRVALQKATQRLRRAVQGQTVPQTDRDAAIASRRADMAGASGQLAALRDQRADVDRWFGSLADHDRVLDHLRRNAEAARNRAVALQQAPEEL